MQIRTIYFLLVSVIFFFSCKKHNDKAALTNCSNLVTDTAGTNDPVWVAMPNAFTPNNDGINDLLRPVPSSGVASISFTLHDDNNTVIFSTNNMMDGFTPATAPVTYATYYYSFQAITILGNHIGGCGQVYSLACLPSSLQTTALYLEDMLLLNGHYQSPSRDPVLNNVCP